MFQASRFWVSGFENSSTSGLLVVELRIDPKFIWGISTRSQMLNYFHWGDLMTSRSKIKIFAVNIHSTWCIFLIYFRIIIIIHPFRISILTPTTLSIAPIINTQHVFYSKHVFKKVPSPTLWERKLLESRDPACVVNGYSPMHIEHCLPQSKYSVNTDWMHNLNALAS